MKLVVVAVVSLAFTGCGSGAPDEQQVKDTARKVGEALTSDHPERVCQYYADHDACVGSIVTAKALGLDLAAVAGLPDDWRARLDKATVTVQGDKAEVSDYTGDGKPGRYFRRGGRWLVEG